LSGTAFEAPSKPILRRKSKEVKGIKMYQNQEPKRLFEGPRTILREFCLPKLLKSKPPFSKAFNHPAGLVVVVVVFSPKQKKTVRLLSSKQASKQGESNQLC
jgi:hypothetical protein